MVLDLRAELGNWWSPGEHTASPAHFPGAAVVGLLTCLHWEPEGEKWQICSSHIWYFCESYLENRMILFGWASMPSLSIPLSQDLQLFTNPETPMIDSFIEFWKSNILPCKCLPFFTLSVFFFFLWEGWFGELEKQTKSFPFSELWANFTLVPSLNKVIYRDVELSIQKDRPCGLKD